VRVNYNFKERRDPVTGSRVFWGDNSSEWWRMFEEEHLLPGCLPLVFKFFTDGTKTLTNMHACPVVLSIANFDPEVQSAAESKVCVGYIPYIDIQEKGSAPNLKSLPLTLRPLNSLFSSINRNNCSDTSKAVPLGGGHSR
jgi:hypothetical protein